MEHSLLKVSVKSLVEYSLRSGSIGFQYQGAGASRALQGAALHRKIQKKRELSAQAGGWSYEREVSFMRKFNVGETDITVRGRADGVIKRDGGIYIEEIKTTEAPLASITENQLHIAQAKCYAYFYMLENEITEIFVLLTYYSIQTSDIKEFEYPFNFEELESFFECILNTYINWALFLISCKKERDASIMRLAFPYEQYRKRQREMCVLVYRAIGAKETVFISAPTGTGKTISTLFPSIKALPDRKADKIFYLTAKTTTKIAALEAVLLMERKGLKIKAVVITAKEKACFLEKPVCEAASCPFANGHFDRVNEALYDILKNENAMTAEIIAQYAGKHTVCPYELSLDVSLWADIIICDYNYAFDPRVYLRRFFAESDENYVFLIDEAHNLADRARDMYSASMSTGGLKALAVKTGKRAGGLKTLAADIFEQIKELSHKITEGDYGLTMETPPKAIVNNLREYCREADRWLTENRHGKLKYYDDILEAYFNFNHFISIMDIFDEKFVCYCEKERKEAILKLFCADPSSCLKERINSSVSAIFFSATLTPPNYFKRILGANEDDCAYLLPNPFPEENIKVIIGAGIAAKYKNRERSYEDIADYILAALNIKPGNYIAFFPSYAYLERVYEIFSDKNTEHEAFAQSPEMTEADREKLIDRFVENERRGLICFAVLGGALSEGVDLPGKRLIGAFIISVGLPKLSFERQLISNYFGADNGMGFEYSYLYPGMNKVLQAGGRVIRTALDKGVIVLMDERFSQRQYKGLFPEAWRRHCAVYNIEAFTEELVSFWAEREPREQEKF